MTHDQVEAMTLADRMMVLNGGRVEQIGTPLEVSCTPGEHVCRRFHRLAADEPGAGRAQWRVGGGRRAADACGGEGRRQQWRHR
ncbi:hypothetical protein ACTMU2_42040 [Cupriavidus basilensis]